MTPTITTVAEAFFTACETGKGWEVCSAYCTPNATFSAQAEPLLDVKTLAQYTDWMKGMLTVLPDARYEVKSFADGQRAEQCRRLWSFLRDAYWSGWAGSSHRPRDQHRLCLRNAVRRRQDRPYDQNMERWHGAQGPRLGIEEVNERNGDVSTSPSGVTLKL